MYVYDFDIVKNAVLTGSLHAEKGWGGWGFFFAVPKVVLVNAGAHIVTEPAEVVPVLPHCVIRVYGSTCILRIDSSGWRVGKALFSLSKTAFWSAQTSARTMIVSPRRRSARTTAVTDLLRLLYGLVDMYARLSAR